MRATATGIAFPTDIAIELICVCELVYRRERGRRQSATARHHEIGRRTRLVRYEPKAVDLLDRLTALPGSGPDIRRAA